MLQIASQHFPELNALNFFSVTVKDMGLLDLQREINLVIFYLNYILIHVNILPYSVYYTKLRVSKNVSIRYNINDCVPNVFGPIGIKLLPISIKANISLKYSTSV